MSKGIDRWQSLGFKRKPFIDLSRTKPFLTAKQQQQLTLLEELVREGGHFLLLLGVSGVGKTTFLNAFKKNIDQSSQDTVIGLCEIQGDPSIHVTVIKSLLAKHLSLKEDIQSDTFLSSLKTRLEQMAQSKGRFLLIVDDAHYLPPETIRFLLDLMSEWDDTAHSLNILLAGRLQLEHLLTSSDWSTNSSFTMVLEPLNEEEVLNYIKHGLRQAGYKGTMPFSKGQINELSVHSKGILARLLVMAVDILETKGRKTKAPAWKLPSKAVWGTLASVALVAIGAVGYYSTSTPAPTVLPSNDKTQVTVEKAGGWVKTVTKPIDVNASDIAPKIKVMSDTPVAAESTAPSSAPLSSAVIAKPIPDPVTAQVVTPNPVVAQATALSPSVPNQPVSEKTVSKTKVLKTTAVTKPAPIEAKAVSKPVSIDTKGVVAAKSIPPLPKDVLITTPIPNDNELSPATKTVATVNASSAPVPTASKTSAPKSPFEAKGYTIQIAGGYDIASVKKTVCQLWIGKSSATCAGLPSNVHYLRTLREGKVWYIATLGQYATSTEASQQLHQLPSSVQKNTPWTRSLEQIPEVTVVG